MAGPPLKHVAAPDKANKTFFIFKCNFLLFCLADSANPKPFSPINKGKKKKKNPKRPFNFPKIA